MPARFLTAFLAIVTFTSSTGLACPMCDSETGGQVRAGIAESASPSTVVAVLAPFLIVSGIAALIHFDLPQGRRRR